MIHSCRVIMFKLFLKILYWLLYPCCNKIPKRKVSYERSLLWFMVLDEESIAKDDMVTGFQCRKMTDRISSVHQEWEGRNRQRERDRERSESRVRLWTFRTPLLKWHTSSSKMTAPKAGTKCSNIWFHWEAIFHSSHCSCKMSGLHKFFFFFLHS